VEGSSWEVSSVVLLLRYRINAARSLSAVGK